MEQNNRNEFIANCHEHVTKPIIIAELLSKIQEVLHLEWIEEQHKDATTKLKKHNTIEDAKVPPKSIVNKIIELSEIGDYSEIETTINQLLKQDQNYDIFSKKVKSYISHYDSERLLKYLETIK